MSLDAVLFVFGSCLEYHLVISLELPFLSVATVQLIFPIAQKVDVLACGVQGGWMVWLTCSAVLFGSSE